MAWVVAMRRPDETPRAFAARLGAARIAFDAPSLALAADGLLPETLHLPFEGPFRVNGTPRPFGPLTSEPQIGWDGGPLQAWTA